MRRYELMLLLRPDLEDDKLQAAVEKVTRAIVNAGGSLSKVSPWGKRRLAYEIGSHRDASYFLIHFDIEPAQVREIERGMLISEEILRHLVTVLEDRGPVEELVPAAAPRQGADDALAEPFPAGASVPADEAPSPDEPADDSPEPASPDEPADDSPAPASPDEPADDSPAANEAEGPATETEDDEVGSAPADEERAEG